MELIFYARATLLRLCLYSAPLVDLGIACGRAVFAILWSMTDVLARRCLPASMTAFDPTYPLYPVFSFFAAALQLIILFTSIVRQNRSLGVGFLCFWLFVANIINAVNAIIWSDNGELKLYVWCDIGRRSTLASVDNLTHLPYKCPASHLSFLSSKRRRPS